MRQYISRLIPVLLLFVAVVVGAAIIGTRCARRSQDPVLAARTGVYVWQQNWSPEVVAAIDGATSRIAEFMVFAAEIETGADRLVTRHCRPDWQALAARGLSVTLVVRAHVGFSRALADEGAGPAAEFVAELVDNMLAEAKQAGLATRAVQLDYDCPTRRLGDYAGLLQALHEKRPNIDFSITALPTWLGHRQFRRLAAEASYYVLQVHSLEKPEHIDDPVALVRRDDVNRWLRRAEALGRPYYLALPTYGYHLIFDADGGFVGLQAEGEELAWEDGYQVRRLMADPVEVAAIVAGLNDSPPRHCLGVAWFRLPVDTDRLNWTWPALEAVMEGRAPIVAFETEARQAEPGLWEVWARNSGERNIAGAIRFPLERDRQSVIAHDFVGGYQESDAGQLVQGPAPRIGRDTLVGWFRLDPSITGETSPIKTGKMEVIPQ